MYLVLLLYLSCLHALSSISSCLVLLLSLCFNYMFCSLLSFSTVASFSLLCTATDTLSFHHAISTFILSSCTSLSSFSVTNSSFFPISVLFALLFQKHPLTFLSLLFISLFSSSMLANKQLKKISESVICTYLWF